MGPNGHFDPADVRHCARRRALGLCVLALGLALTMHCTDDEASTPTATPVRHGGDGGAPDYGGAGGIGGTAGRGSAGDGRGGSTCPGGCQGYYAHARVTGSGFPHPDGTPVQADADARPDGTTIEDGRFLIDIPPPCSCVTRGPGIDATLALYIDVDRDGTCNPLVDDLFVWKAVAASRTDIVELALTPAAARCTGLDLPYPDNAALLATTQRLCPPIGACLDFCDSPPASDTLPSPLLCRPEDAGTDASASDASAL